MVADPMQTFSRKSPSVQSAVTILNGSPLIFKTKAELSEVIKSLWVDTVHLVDACGSIAIEVHLADIMLIRQAQILHVTGKEHSLPLLTVAE